MVMAAIAILSGTNEHAGDTLTSTQNISDSAVRTPTQEPLPLPSARKINQMIDHHTFGGGGKYIRCEYREPDQTMTQSRIIRARTRKGQLEVRPIGEDNWVVPTRIWES